MNCRPFSDGVSVSEVGLGAWQLGGDWGAVGDGEATAILDAALDAGVTFLDTADVYGAGRSERRIGEYLRGTDKRPFVATKLGRYPEPGWPGNFSLDTFRRHTEASLKRLGVDRLDLTQAHCLPTELLRKGEVFDWLRSLQSEGLVARWGLSVESMEEAAICLEQEGLSSLQIIFNPFRQKPARTIFDDAVKKGVALIVRLPLASGLLTGKMTSGMTFDEEDHRQYNRNGEVFNVGETFAGLPFEVGVKLADGLKALVPDGMTMAQFTLRWILDHDAVTTVIPGASRPSQAEANAAVSGLAPLSRETHAAVREYYESHVAAHIRGPY